MGEDEGTPLKIDLNEDEYRTLEKMAENRGMDIDEFLNHVLSKHSSFWTVDSTCMFVTNRLRPWPQ